MRANLLNCKNFLFLTQQVIYSYYREMRNRFCGNSEKSDLVDMHDFTQNIFNYTYLAISSISSTIDKRVSLVPAFDISRF